MWVIFFCSLTLTLEHRCWILLRSLSSEWQHHTRMFGSEREHRTTRWTQHPIPTKHLSGLWVARQLLPFASLLHFTLFSSPASVLSLWLWTEGLELVFCWARGFFIPGGWASLSPRSKSCFCCCSGVDRFGTEANQVKACSFPSPGSGHLLRETEALTALRNRAWNYSITHSA